MDYLLACHHTGTVRSVADLGAYLDCAGCGGTQRKLLAVETREWHAHCHDCRFGRWCGQSRNNADWYTNQHALRYLSHNPIVDYQRYQATYDAVRKLLPRSVKPYIAVNVAPKRPLKFLPATLTEVTKSQSACDDVPPF